MLADREAMRVQGQCSMAWLSGNSLSGRVLRAQAWSSRETHILRVGAGGILADEVGLGKTVDIITLMLHHPLPAAGSLSGTPNLQSFFTCHLTCHIVIARLEL